MTNVLLVILDSVRAENTSMHGHHHDTTPFLERFVEERATRYPHARSPGARSLTSHTSIFSGYDVEAHGVLSAAQRLEPSESVFYELSESGYDTAVFTENNWITSVDVGLKDGFDEIYGHENTLFRAGLTPTEFVAREGRGHYGAYLTECLRHEHPVRSLANGVATKVASDYPSLAPSFVKASAPGSVYAERFIDWVDNRSGPWAACVNLMDAHIPYEPEGEHDLWGGKKARKIQNSITDYKWEFASGRRPWWQLEVCESLYDGGIRQGDAAVKRIVDHLERVGELNETLVVVTSDHGEGFGEQSYVRPGVRVAEHGVAIHDVVTRVPLVVKFPGQTEPGRVDRPATLTRFPAVVQSARDGSWDEDAFVPRDRPVVVSAAGLDEPLSERASNYLDDLSSYTAMSRAVFDPTDDGRVRGSITWRDNAATVENPDERTHFLVDRTGRERVESVFAAIEDVGVRVEAGGVDAMDDETYQRLEDLGYV